MMTILIDNKSDIVVRELFKLYREVVDSRNDGFTQWGYKQSLIDLKFMLDNILNNCPNFGKYEDDYLNQKEQEKIVGILKK